MEMKRRRMSWKRRRRRRSWAAERGGGHRGSVMVLLMLVRRGGRAEEVLGRKRRRVDENVITAAGVTSSDESEEEAEGEDSAMYSEEQDELETAAAPAEEEDVDMLAEEDEEEEEEEDDSSFSTSAVPTPLDYSRMTARQRAREGVDPTGLAEELQSLPMADVSKKKVWTETELALRKSEQSRKRKNQADKKLEEEKQETINRLLKKQVGKSASRKSGMGTEAEDDRGGKSQRVFVPQPKSYRYIASIKSGEYKATLSAPTGWEQRLSASKLVQVLEDGPKPGQIIYPPPRPPPETRRFLKA
ncbi:hypothetical protein BT69DRAFT_831559 [Atractiella rhizophila]|nr:hypothetical protein BT69DRAFT_831559 [Atractiella rhizophila]